MRQERASSTRSLSSSSRRQAKSSTLISTKALLTLFLAHSAAAVNSRTQCLISRSAELSELSACGDKGSLNYCFSHRCHGGGGDSVTVQAADLEVCFRDAGCTAEEAAIEAEWTVRRCDERPEDGADLGDLRRRQGGNNNNNNNDDDDKTTTQPARTSTNRNQVTSTTNRNQRTSTNALTTASTTAAPGTTQSPETADSTTSEQQRTVSAAQLSTQPSKLECHTLTTVSTSSCPIQSTGAESGKTLQCFPTTASFQVCAAGLLCMADQQGLPICIRVENTFTTTGIVITIVFGSFALIAAAMICFFCCRERSAERKMRRAAEAAAIAKEAKAAAILAKKRPSVNVRSVSGQSDSAPLMPPSAPQGYSGGGGGGAQYMGGSQDPFADQQQQYGGQRM